MVDNNNNSIDEQEKLLDLPIQLTAGDLSDIMEIPPSEVIKELMRHGVMANINEIIEFEVAVLVAHEFGFKVLKPKSDSTKTLKSDFDSSNLNDDSIKKPNGNYGNKRPDFYICGDKTEGSDCIGATEDEFKNVVKILESYQKEIKKFGWLGWSITRHFKNNYPPGFKNHKDQINQSIEKAIKNYLLLYASF